MTRHYIDCRQVPGDSGCTVAISADSAEELVDAAADHAVKVHKHADGPELRETIRTMIKQGTPPA